MTINATAVWRVHKLGDNNNGGGYDAAISGAGTDYSKQNNAQLTGIGSGSSTGTTNFQDNTVTFTSAMVGNALHVANPGSGVTVGWYFVVGFVDAHNVTLDRTHGTGTTCTWALGGAWTDLSNLATVVVPGNITYVLGTGMPNPASYSYDYSMAHFTPVSGDETNGYIKIIGDPATPSGGFPCIQATEFLIFNNQSGLWLENLWFVPSSSTFGDLGVVRPAAGMPSVVKNVYFDQFGYDGGLLPNNTSAGGACHVEGGEISSSVAKRTTNLNPGLSAGNGGVTFFAVNVHDCIGPGISLDYMARALCCTSTKNGGDGVVVTSFADGRPASMILCTVDDNLGHGVNIATQQALANFVALDNMITNHTASSKYGMIVGAGTTDQNDRIKSLIDYQTWYNNTTDVSAISRGSHDTTGGTDPYTDQTNNDYTLVSGRWNTGTLPDAPLAQRIAGWNG